MPTQVFGSSWLHIHTIVYLLQITKYLVNAVACPQTASCTLDVSLDRVGGCCEMQYAHGISYSIRRLELHISVQPRRVRALRAAWGVDAIQL